MDEKCAICGSKFKRWDSRVAFSADMPDVMLCQTCADHKSNIEQINPADSDQAKYEYGMSRRYLLRLCEENAEMDEGVRISTEALCGITQEEKALDRERAERFADNERRIEEELDLTMATASFEFIGYEIVAYHGMVSAANVQGSGVFTDIKSAFSDMAGVSSGALSNVTQTAFNFVKRDIVKAAYRAGGNAVIGVDIKPYVFAGNMVGLFATGTSVTVRKL